MSQRDHFLRRRAKRGFGPERAQLLKDLWMEENALTHFIIQTVAGTSRVTGLPVEPDKELVAKRAACEAEIARLAARLQEITGDPPVQA